MNGLSPLPNANAKIQHFFDIYNTLSPNSRHLSRQYDCITPNPIHLTFYLLWGPQSKPAERLLWGESVEQYVALHKGFARNRASISLSIKKVKSKKYRIIIIHRAGTRTHDRTIASFKSHIVDFLPESKPIFTIYAYL